MQLLARALWDPSVGKHLLARDLRGKLHGEDQADQAKDQDRLILPTREPRKRAPTASRPRNA